MTRLPFRLDPDRCDGCGECLRVCAPRAIDISGGTIAIDPDLCDGCEDCALACPTPAITLLRRGKSAPAPEPSASVTAAPDGGAEPGTERVDVGAATPPGGVVIPLATRPGVDEGGRARWRRSDLAVGMLVLVFLQLVLRMLPTAEELGPMGRWIVMVGTLLFYGSVTGLVWMLARRRGFMMSDLGLARFKVGRSSAAVVGLMVVLLFTRHAYIEAARLLGFTPPSVEEQLLGLFGRGAGGLVLALAVTVGLAAFVEELFFRGFIYGVLRERLRAGYAIPISAAIFAVYHFSLWLALPILLLGIALAWLVEWQRSIWPAVLCHALNNALAVAVVYGEALRAAGAAGFVIRGL